MDSKDKNWKPRRVLVGYDGSEGATDAVALAKTLCAGDGAHVLLVNVLPYPGPWPVAYRLLGYEEAPAWKTFFRAAEESLAGIEVDHRTYVGGSPAKVLNNISEKEDFDLVVVGSPHRGAIGRALVGSVAEGLLHGASVAVVAAPRGYAKAGHEGFGRVVVGYDGSSEADEAVRWGTAVAGREGCLLDIVSVTTPPTAAPGPFAGPIPSTLPDAAHVVREGVESVKGEVEVHGEALRGAVVPELVVYTNDDDLLLLGSRGYGPVARTFLGSISSALIHNAPCPVLIVPRPEEPRESAVEPQVAAVESA